MTKLTKVGAAALTLAIFAIATPACAQEAAAGAKLYQQKCANCHALDANKIGPMHRGVVGRKAGAAPQYAYSNALKASGLVWSEANINLWLQGPQKLVRGTKMYLMVPSPTDRASIIAYLKAQT